MLLLLFKIPWELFPLRKKYQISPDFNFNIGMLLGDDAASFPFDWPEHFLCPVQIVSMVRCQSSVIWLICLTLCCLLLRVPSCEGCLSLSASWCRKVISVVMLSLFRQHSIFFSERDADKAPLLGGNRDADEKAKKSRWRSGMEWLTLALLADSWLFRYSVTWGREREKGHYAYHITITQDCKGLRWINEFFQLALTLETLLLPAYMKICLFFPNFAQSSLSSSFFGKTLPAKADVRNTVFSED